MVATRSFTLKWWRIASAISSSISPARALTICAPRMVSFLPSTSLIKPAVAFIRLCAVNTCHREDLYPNGIAIVLSRLRLSQANTCRFRIGKGHPGNHVIAHRPPQKSW